MLTEEPGWPGMSKPCRGEAVSARVSSTSLSSSSPARSFLRKDSRVAAPALADQGVEQALLGGGVGAGPHPGAAAVADHGQGAFHQVADDLVDVAADVADLGELGRLDFQERRLGEAGEAPGDLGLADAGGADHQDVLGRHLVAQVRRHAPAAPAVAQGHGHGALGLGVADHEAVEFGDDLAGGEFGHGPPCAPTVSTVSSRLV